MPQGQGAFGNRQGAASARLPASKHSQRTCGRAQTGLISAAVWGSDPGADPVPLPVVCGSKALCPVDDFGLPRWIPLPFCVGVAALSPLYRLLYHFFEDGCKFWGKFSGGEELSRNVLQGAATGCAEGRPRQVVALRPFRSYRRGDPCGRPWITPPMFQRKRAGAEADSPCQGEMVEDQRG